MRFSSLVLSGLLVLLVPALARAQGRVSIEELTVDGDPPPDMYRAMLVEGIRPSVEEIGVAYGRRLAERPGLSGDYRLRLWVSNREVVRITPESSIGDATMEQAARDAIYRFRLPDAAPAGGAWVRFVVRFTAPAGSTAAPTTSTTPAAASPPSTPSSSTPPSSGSSAAIAGAAAVAGSTSVVVGARTPTVTFSRVTGTLAQDAVAAQLPISAIASCVSTTRGGTLRMTVSISRRGRVTARRTSGTFSHSRSVSCIDRAIEALTPGADAGPTVARVIFTIPAATP